MIAAHTDTAVALFGKTRRNVLALVFGQPDRSFYLREIAHARAGDKGDTLNKIVTMTRARVQDRTFPSVK